MVSALFVAGLMATQAMAFPHLMYRNATSPTCEGNADDGTVYRAANANYDILCGTDYAGGDFSSATVSSFAECIDLCDTTASCIDVSFLNGACYLKSSLGAPSSNSYVWTARSQSAVTCQGGKSSGTTYTTAQGTFAIECGVDYFGGDLTSTIVNSFADCIDVCGANSACVDVSYVNGACYLKAAISGTPETNAYISTARRLQAKPSITCPANDGQLISIPTGGAYEIKCYQDYAGGDFAATSAASFELCLESCDAHTGCEAVAYVGQACYLKNQVNTPQPNGIVYGAVKVIDATS